MHNVIPQMNPRAPFFPIFFLHLVFPLLRKLTVVNFLVWIFSTIFQSHHHDAWADVYRYWKEKRVRLGKPLLRRFWPVTSPSDTDPHKVRTYIVRRRAFGIRGGGCHFCQGKKCTSVKLARFHVS